MTKDDGIAILDQGECFGGGQLQEYGINSNTSSNGFMKCTYRKKVSQFNFNIQIIILSIQTFLYTGVGKHPLRFTKYNPLKATRYHEKV